MEKEDHLFVNKLFPLITNLKKNNFLINTKKNKKTATVNLGFKMLGTSIEFYTDEYQW